MNKQELINELNKYKERYQGSIDEYYQGRHGAYDVALKLVEKLEQTQKPIVPQFVADWFEDNKDDLEFAIWKLTIDSNSNYTKDKHKMRHWIQHAPNKPYKTLIKMLDGYEVEKEPLFLMPVPYVPYPVHYCVDEDGKVSYRQGNAQKFTQEELDKYFPEIKQFAVSVEVDES